MGKTVIAVNMQRGRDPDSNPVREGIAAALADPVRQTLLAMAPNVTPSFQRMADLLTDQLHRGKQLLNVFMCHCINSCKGNAAWTIDYPDRFMKSVNPVFISYRQAERMPFMDSVVFTMPVGQRGDYQEMLAIYADMTKRDPGQLKQRIAALRAVRTMRMEGTLKGAS